MTRFRFALLSAGAVFAAAFPAHANDTTAVLGAGGLELATSRDITMEHEDLYISADEVRVDYVYNNTSDKDVETVVAFPMPDIKANPEPDIGVADRQSDNFMDFTVKQDGMPIKTELQQRVIVGGLDVTGEVEAQHIPKFPLSDKALAAIKALPADVARDWIARGLIYEDVYDAGNGEVHEYAPAWTLRSTFWWRTIFPAHQRVQVHHSYRPSVGGTVAMTYIADGKPGNSYGEYRSKYCIDDSFMKMSAKLEQEQKDKPDTFYYEKWLSYILTTGGNWAGPIGTFHLTVDKGKPDTYVSFCGDGVKKTGPTTFELTKTDFYPERELDILLVEKAPPPTAQ
nr:DUF4424 domain-containing protein [uncultured Gellertiella sp.]